MFRTLCVVALLLPASAWGITPFANNLTVRLVVTGGPSGKQIQETEYWTGTKRISDTAHKRMIVDFEKKTLTTIYKESKAFSVQTFEDIRQLQEGMKQRLNNLPPQMQSQLNTGAPPVEVRATGKSQQLLGYEIKEYSLQGPLTGSVWVAESVEVAPAAQEFAQLVRQMGDPTSPGRQLAEGLAQIKGLPLKMSISSPGGPNKIVTNTEAVEISDKPPPAGLLEIPEGYVKAEVPKLSQ